MRNNFPKGTSGALLHTLSELYNVPVGFVTHSLRQLDYCKFAVAKGLRTLVLVNPYLFLLSCGTGSRCCYSCITARLSDDGLPSLFVAASHYISRFTQVECTFFLTIPNCVHLAIGVHFNALLAVIFRYIEMYCRDISYSLIALYLILL